MFSRPFSDPVMVAGENAFSPSEVAPLGPEQVREPTVPQTPLNITVGAMKSKLVSTREELKEVRSGAEKAQSLLASQIQTMQEEKRSLVSELEEMRRRVGETQTQEIAAMARVTALESDLTAVRKEVVKSAAEEQSAAVLPEKVIAPSVEAEATARSDDRTQQQEEHPGGSTFEEPGDVTPEELHQAIFSDVAEKIVFTRAVVDITNRSEAARLDTAKVMGGIRHQLSARVLSAQLRREASSRVRQECVKALTSLGMEEGHAALQYALADHDPSVRLAAVWGVYRLYGNRSAPILTDMLSDQDAGVRRRAIACIGWLGREELATTLLPLLDDKSPVVRLAAIDAMSQLRSRKVVAALVNRLNDPEVSIAKAALRTIETITEKKMGKSFPASERLRQRLMVRWDHWWKGQCIEWDSAIADGEKTGVSV